MPQEIYNEGRVIGFSAWELFAKIAEAQGVTDVPSETEWLASMIGSGASMILKVPRNTTKGIHDYALPAGSNLSAAGVIVANPFLGDCAWDTNDMWATKVTSYSPLINNTSSSSPTSSTVPSGTYSPAAYSSMLNNFMKLTDGIVYTKSATWIQTPDEDGNPGVPYKDIDPKFPTSTTIVRLYVDATLTSDVYVLLTGFKNKYMLQCFAGHAVSDGATPPRSECGSADVAHNEHINGGMLGPKFIPWASKIVFSVPSTVYNLTNSLTRTIPSDTSYSAKTVGGITFKDINSTVKSTSFIDFNSINLGDYYSVHSSEFSVTPTLQENVSALSLGASNSYNSLVAWYPGMTAAKISAATNSSKIFPPALYGAYVSSTGTQTLVPLDVAAPGTVKGFKNATQAYNYTQQMPDNFAMYYNPTTASFAFVRPNEPDPANWPGLANLYYGAAPYVSLAVGAQETKLISLTDANGNNYDLDGADGEITIGPTDMLRWQDLVYALSLNRKLDILGYKLRNLGTELTAANTIGRTNHVSAIGADGYYINSGNAKEITLTSDTASTIYQITSATKYLKLPADATIQVGKDYITFSNGLRLYISQDNPGTTGVPTGSIGIGW